MEEISIRRSFTRYVSLNVIGMLGLSCYILADTFFVARGIGADGLAALNLAIPVYSFIHGTGLMIGMGGATRFTISKSESVFTQALYYAFFTACFFTIMGVFFSEPIAALLGASGGTLENTTVYLRTILCFSPMFLLNNVIICFVRNDGNPKLSMFAMLTGSFSNVILDYIFIFPLGMGMFGAAFATGIAPVISLTILSIHLLKKRNTFHCLRQTPRFRDFADLSALGISAWITELSSGIVIIVFNMLLLQLAGNTGVAAYGILANIALVILAVFTGIAQGMQPIVSLSHREKHPERIRKVLQYGFLTAGVIAVLVYILSFLFAEPIVAAFNKDGNAQLAEIAVQGMRIYFTAFVFAEVNLLCAACFSAVDCPKNAFVISLLRGFLIIVPAALILSALFGINGVWTAMTVSEFVVLLVSIWMLRKSPALQNPV